jgi:hypothetical protein
MILKILEFSPEVFEKFYLLNVFKIRTVGIELFLSDGQTDGRTDRNDKANSRFLEFVNVSKNNTNLLGNI